MADPRSSGSERAPSQAEVIRRAVRAMASEIRVCLPGAIHKWDPSIGRAEVKVLVKQAYIDEEDNRQVESYPILTGVAVQFPGGGGARLTFPLCDGNTQVDGGVTPPATTGTLIFSDASLDKWLSGQGQEVDPAIDHFHDLSDPIFYPGLMPFGAPWGDVPSDHATLGVDDGVQLHLRKDTLVAAKKDDEASAQFVALANKVLDELNAIKTAHNTHKHGGVQTGTGASGSADVTYTPNSVACDQFKAK